MGALARVGLDAREAFRERPRGVGVYVRNLIREFAAVCPEIEFVLYHEREAPAELQQLPANMHPKRVELPGGRFQSWERVAMPWRMRRDDLSVYHGTYNTLPPRWWAWPGPPMVVTVHDVIVTWWPDNLEDPYVKYCRSATWRIVEEAALILTVSEWSKGDIVERFDVRPEKVRVCRNGVHPDFRKGAPEGAGDRARAMHADGRPYLFAIGSHLERKNIGRLIDALGVMEGTELLLISGMEPVRTGPFRERAARAGVLDRVRFLPYLELSELIALYAGAELVVYPSQAEGWGLPVVEALAVGTPVATSWATAMPEAGGEHARYFDPLSADSIASTLREALDKPEGFAAIRDAAMRRARSFSWRGTAEATLAGYREVAD